MLRMIPDILAASSSARALAVLEFGGGRRVTIWENAQDFIRYDATSGHVFSLYLQGGGGSRRLDAGGVAGWRGAVCVMPQGASSEWEIADRFRFVHLFCPDDQLRAAFSHAHDRDARMLSVEELTFANAPKLAGPLAIFARAALQGEPLAAESAFAELVGRLTPRPPRLSGGLSPYLLRRLDDWIEAHLEGPIRLRDLAAVAGLSEFHLQRMFCASRGLSPHGWVEARRVARAREMMTKGASVAGVAAACGFSSQSHLTRVFHRATGMTPARYRRAQAM